MESMGPRELVLRADVRCRLRAPTRPRPRHQDARKPRRFSIVRSFHHVRIPEPWLAVGGSSYRGTEGPAACGNLGAAAARGGGNGGIGLRAGAAAGRGGGAGIAGRRVCSETLAMSLDICCWLALSCSMLALICSISCSTVARARVVDWDNCTNSADTAAAVGAMPSRAILAGGAGCGSAASPAGAL